jgi:hypothetical protein
MLLHQTVQGAAAHKQQMRVAENALSRLSIVGRQINVTGPLRGFISLSLL